MKNIALALICNLTILCFTGCSLEYEYTEDDIKNEYLVNWINKYGLIDPAQDFNLAVNVRADIDCESFGTGKEVWVYDADPAVGGVAVAHVNKSGTYGIDLRENSTSVYVKVNTPGSNKYRAGEFAVADGKIKIAATSRGELAEGEDEMPASRASADGGQYNWILACEDLGSTADVDFNDIVLGITYRTGDTQLTITPLAAGGIYEAWVCHGTGDNRKRLFEIHQAFGSSEKASGQYSMYNTYNPTFARPGTPYDIEVPANFSITDKMGGISIEVIRPTGSAVASTLIEAPGAMDANPSAPQIICVPGGWEWPIECVNINDAYPEFTDWNRNHTVNTWDQHKAPNAKLVHRGTAPNVNNAAETERHLTINGKSRKYRIYVPANAGVNTPVVFSLHGARGSATSYEPIAKTVADTYKFIVVYPEGLYQGFQGGTNDPDVHVRGWNAGGYTGTNGNRERETSYQDEIDFLRAIISDVDDNFNIDRHRIYCCGFSNGGMMTYAAAYAMADEFAAFASISGLQMNEFHHRWSNARPVPFMHIHGKNDGWVNVIHMPTIRNNMIARNGCKQIPTTTNGGSYTKYVYEPLEGGMPYVNYIVEGMEHDASTNNTEDGSSSVTMWKFVSQYSLDTPCDRTLKWRFNVDYAGYNIDDNADWRVTRSDGMVKYEYGQAQKAGNADENVYPELQFEPGSYYLEFNTSGGSANDYVYIFIEPTDGTSQAGVVYHKVKAGQRAVIPFSIDAAQAAKGWKLTIFKDNTSTKFTKFEIRGGSASSTGNPELSQYPAMTDYSHYIDTPVAQTHLSETGVWGQCPYTEADGVTTYTAVSTCKIAFKTLSINVAGCDFVEIRFAEPITKAGWQVWVKDSGALSTPVNVGDTYYRVYMSDVQDAITDNVLNQLTMLVLDASAENPVVAKVSGIYKHCGNSSQHSH